MTLSIERERPSEAEVVELRDLRERRRLEHLQRLYDLQDKHEYSLVQWGARLPHGLQGDFMRDVTASSRRWTAFVWELMNVSPDEWKRFRRQAESDVGPDMASDQED